MIKVEQDMLVLDASFTKQDAQAINEFANILKRQERERIVKMLEDYIPIYYRLSPNNERVMYPIETIIEMIKELNETTKHI